MDTEMAWTQGWHGHRDGMDTAMPWDTATHGPHDQMNMGWMCAVGMQPAAARLDTRAVRVSRAFCVDCLVEVIWT